MDSKTWRLVLVIFSMVLVSSNVHVMSEDWPMWRYDSSRSAATREKLSNELHLRWIRELPPIRVAWPHVARLHFDGSYEPVVMGKLLFLSSPNDGSVTAFHTRTGEEIWKFYTEAPVRFAPVAWENKVYAGSDDGYLYCLDAANGDLLWKLRGVPRDRPDRRHLGNNRLISFWPVRGGPVLKDGIVYFAAGIWPTLGVFITALNAETGELIWRNERLNYIEKVRIDHNQLKDTGLSPQGYIVAVGDKLLVPNGRSMPAGLDRKTGELIYYCQGYRHGDCRVIANEDYALVGKDGAVSMDDFREVGSKWAKAQGDAPNGWDAKKRDLFEGPFWKYKMLPGCNARSVLESGICYGMESGVFYAYDLREARSTEYDRESDGVIQRPLRWEAPELWKLGIEDTEGKSEVLIKAGERLYGHVGKTLIALELSGGDTNPKIVWREELDETPSSMLAADSRLFVVTRGGGIYCFGSRKLLDKPELSEIRRYEAKPEPLQRADDGWIQKAANILKHTKIRDGYCLVLGLETGRLLEELIRQSKVKVIGIDADSDKINRLRSRLVAAGIYGTRVELFVGDPADFPFSSYIADLIVSENYGSGRFLSTFSSEKIFNILHPYGGTLCLEMPERSQNDFEVWAERGMLANAQLDRSGEFALLRKTGGLPGAAAWTHEAADSVRSYYSRDELVKAPLGFLWYGDGEDYGFYKTHDYGLGVKPQAVDGRMFALQQFSGTLFAYDAYTGRVLWKRQIYPATQKHPFVEDGSFDWHWVSLNRCITRYASMNDGIYVAYKGKCAVYDPATGAELKTFQYHRVDENAQPPVVKDIRVSRDTIIIAISFTESRRIVEGLWDSIMLVALDRENGDVIWKKAAKDRFNCKAIAAYGDTVFCIDSPSPIETERSMRRGEDPEAISSAIMALDARTGEAKWTQITKNAPRIYDSNQWLSFRQDDDWLAYSKERGLVLAGKQGKGYAFDAETGEVIWAAKSVGSQPIILMGDTFMNQYGDIFHTISGEMRGDKISFRRGGCNYGVAGKHLVLIGDKTVCYVDSHTGKRNYLRVIRSGCSASLIAANGLLNAPNFSSGCMCNYPIQTSFAMTYMPEIEAWAGSVPTKMNQ